MTSEGGDGPGVGAGEARVFRLLEHHRTAIQIALDSLGWTLALVLALLFRFDLRPSAGDFVGLLPIVPLAVLAQVVAGLSAGLYTGRWRFGSFEEVAALVWATLVTTGVVFLANLWVQAPDTLVPRSVPIAGGLAALVLMAGVRYGWRLGLERRRRPTGADLQRLLVFGAGEGGAQVIAAMLRDPESPYLPVALLDDDPAKRNLRIMGVPVVGTRAAVSRAAADYKADVLLIAIPSAGASLVTELSEVAAAAGLDVKVLPPVGELFGGPVGVGDIRDVTTSDLLGRHEVHTDLESIAGYLTGRRVLVTGAGGSIGSELCRQIYCFAPSELIMVDHDESALHAVQLSIQGRALLDSPDLVLLDIRERAAVERVLAERRPEVVFHAAALKHLPLLERHPVEAVKTNVWGTLDLLEASVAAGVKRFVNISTDKAADPASVLGTSKRIGERLTAYVASATGRPYVSVRFGNVLGSRGSVLTTFQSQIERGGPITVTDPDVTRYFMTVEEAVQLVIQAGAIGSPGEVLVLDMGEPVRIAELARVLAARAERTIAVEFTGLRPGEKLHEALLASGEVDCRSVHPLISHVGTPPLDPAAARAIDVGAGEEAVARALADLCLQPAQA
ncbi:MAG TPA: nucleoside-diphosphate sugar epimerase/dehydratase [Acidimicrobiales bacterium]|nr:nucleoside-diphosphate sugar epimerase/dehydratase [Acidimicrobiales bacterium]